MKKNSPLVSVVVATKDRRDMFRKAITSVLAQTYQNWELIIVDDGSKKPYYKEIIEDLCIKKRVKMAGTTHSRGVSAARNDGTRLSEGKYIAILDDDDIYHPKLLEESVGMMEKYERDVLFCGFEMINYTTGEKKISKPRPYSLARLLYGINNYIHGGTLIRKNWMVKHQYNTTLKWGSDYDMFLRMAMDGARFGVNPNIRYYITVHHGRITYTEPKQRDTLLSQYVRLFYENLSHDKREEFELQKRIVLFEDGTQDLNPYVSVIITNYNQEKTLYKILEVLEKQTFKNFEVIILDDGSERPLLYYLRDKKVKYKYHYSRNEGYRINTLRNLGIRMADGEVLAFMDGDLIPEEDFVEKIAFHQFENDDCVLIHGRVKEKDGLMIDRDKNPFDDNDPWYNFTGGNFSVKREAFRKVGFFDEDYDGHWGYDDTDWAYRAHKAKLKLDLGLDIMVRHQNHHSDRVGYHRNQKVFFSKHPELKKEK